MIAAASPINTKIFEGSPIGKTGQEDSGYSRDRGETKLYREGLYPRRESNPRWGLFPPDPVFLLVQITNIYDVSETVR